MKKVIIAVIMLSFAVMSGGAWGAYYDEGNDGDSWETAYIIDSVDDLNYMLRTYLFFQRTGKYFKLATDIDLSSKYWTGVYCFDGHFDGQNHTITVDLLDLDLPVSSQEGNANMAYLFQTVSSDGIAIRNLNVRGKIRAENSTNPYLGTAAAGIVLLLRAGIIENCSFTGTIEAINTKDDGSAFAGGIAARSSGAIRNCTVQADITANASSDSLAGGICAIGKSIENCKVLSGSTVTASGREGCAGGIAGFAGSIAGNNSTITNCLSEALIEGNVPYKGGIAGDVEYYEGTYYTILTDNTWPSQYPEVGNSQEDGPSTPDTPNTPSTSISSSDLSTTWNSHKYTVFNSPMTWTEAKSYCESLGGHLVTITSKEEYDAILNALPQDEKRLYWLGASDADNEGSWQWITGEDFSFTKWLSGEPNGGNSENYLILTNYYNDVWGWNDATNSHAGIDPSNWSFICEWEPAEAAFAPMNPEYLRFLENPAAYLDGSEFYGDIPDPLDLSHLANNPPRNIITTSSLFFTSALPTKYDPRNSGILPPVRTQSPYGTCWSFASLGALEINYLRQKLGNNLPETSELHQAWFVYKDTRQGYSFPLNNPNKHVLDQGGTNSKSIAFLARAGTASENELSYGKASEVQSLTRGKYPENYSNPIRIKEAYRLGRVTRENRDEVKNMIYQHGAVTVTFDSSAPIKNSYYYRTTKEHGHMVDAVGWDDNYSRENFGQPKPSSNGAWLIRNSWGTDNHDEGYFWMSYEQTIGDSAVYIAAENSSLKHRGYDVLTQAGRNTFRWSANIFKAEGNETVKEIAFTTTDNNVPYELYINKLGKTYPVNPGVPSDKIASGIMSFAGYHTITLSSPVSIADGEYFAVILKTEAASSYEYTSAVEDTETVRTASVNVGESYFSRTSATPGSKDWIDGVTLTVNGRGRPSNACIKAFTQATGYVPPQPTPEPYTPTPTPETPSPTPDTPTPETPKPTTGNPVRTSDSGGCSSSSAGLAVILAFWSMRRRKKYS